MATELSALDQAFEAWQAGTYRYVQNCAADYNISYSTLIYRIHGRQSRSSGHKFQQNLSQVQEETLVRCITRLTTTGFPISPALAMQLANEIRLKVLHPGQAPPRPMSYSWLRRFCKRHNQIASVWARKIDHARFCAVTQEGIKPWFNAMERIKAERNFVAANIYNMDEVGFAIGDSQSSRVLVNIDEASSWKTITGRQEWITSIEYINAEKRATTPFIIFKAKYTNVVWIPEGLDKDWFFSTSNSGWSSNSHGFIWLRDCFEPQTRPIDPEAWRLLICDGHSSHITASFILHCMNCKIELLVLPPHSLHVTQPLDVGIFAPLKHILSVLVDEQTRLQEARRPTRAEWVEMYVTARERAMTGANLASAWSATGLLPFNPARVLNRLQTTQQEAEYGSSRPSTPSAQSLDLSLLSNTPRHSTALRKANAHFHEQLLRAGPSLLTPVKAYGYQLAKSFESVQSKLIIAQYEAEQAKQQLQKRKKRITKRVKIGERFCYTTAEIYEIVEKAEAAKAAQEACKGKKQAASSRVAKGPDIIEDSDALLATSSSSSDAEDDKEAPE